MRRRPGRVRAHPRSRGENEVVHEVHSRVQGSSPLTRGKPDRAAGPGQVVGLIPAHAGKTRTCPPASCPRRAHPRSRGENSCVASSSRACRGSSPLTRGKPKHSDGSVPSTPAHPRSRGENRPSRTTRARATGSSPLTRGKHPDPLSASVEHGLIPAHAGKTSSPPLAGAAGRAHPRSRGENGTEDPVALKAKGSSPLTRGKHTFGGVEHALQGLIPAHAGKTESQQPRRRHGRAHPRSRGENFACLPTVTVLSGSSPLTRGKRDELIGREGPGGLIPAHAGKTLGRS